MGRRPIHGGEPNKVPVSAEATTRQAVARYIERGPLSLEKLSIQDDIVSYSTNDGVKLD
jgi:hypothetical protein